MDKLRLEGVGVGMGGGYRRLQPVSLPIVHTTDTSCTRFILPWIYPKGKYTLCAVVQDICTLVQWVGIPGKQSFMSREVWVERSVVGKYEQHKCEYSWRICTIVQHSEGPGPLTASIQISYFRRFWSKWSQWLENSLLFSNNGVNFENGVKNHILHDNPGQSCPAQPVSRWPTLFVSCGLMVKSENLSPCR